MREYPCFYCGRETCVCGESVTMKYLRRVAPKHRVCVCGEILTELRLNAVMRQRTVWVDYRCETCGQEESRRYVVPWPKRYGIPTSYDERDVLDTRFEEGPVG